jgi:hypothetical protein
MILENKTLSLTHSRPIDCKLYNIVKVNNVHTFHTTAAEE